MRYQGCRRFIIVIFLALGIVFFIINQIQLSAKKGKIESGTEFSGSIKKINISRNHSFGIILIEIQKISWLNNEALNYSIGNPFRIKEKEAEVYGTIGYNDTLANYILVNTTNNKFLLYRNDELISEGNLVWLNEVQNLDFIEKNSKFNSGN